MRFMMIMIPKGYESAKPGTLPDAKAVAAMMKYNEELVKAGVMLAGEGLHSSAKGARIRYDGGKRTIVDGPFAEAKELVAGFWIIQVRSREEALEWAKRIPFQEGEVELRQVHEAEDFAPVDPTGELRAKEQQLRDSVARQRS